MSKNTKNRFVGTNWDDIKVSVGETSARKVITKGKDTMEVCTRAMGGFKQTLSDKKVKLASLPKKDEEAVRAYADCRVRGRSGEGLHLQERRKRDYVHAR